MSGQRVDSLRNKEFGFVFQQFFLNGKDTAPRTKFDDQQPAGAHNRY
jgi:hypothetical protein